LITQTTGDQALG